MKVINLCFHKGTKLTTTLILFWLCYFNTVGQSKHSGLIEGKKIPHILVNSTINNSVLPIDFASLKGKLIILDFWNTACSSCIANMPKMDSLQVKYDGKIQILMVTKNKPEEVENLFKRIGIKAPHIPSITRDTLLNKLFPHYAEPHHVWIDQAGIYLFSTFDHNATGKNIERFLQGKKPSMTQKNDGVFQEDQSILSQINDTFRPLVYQYSIFMKGLNRYAVGGGSGRIGHDSLSKWPCSYTAINLTPLTMIQEAYNKEVYGYEIGLLNLKSNKRLILETDNNELLYEPLNPDEIDHWRLEHNWSWEIKVNPRSADDLFQTMQNELNQTLPYEGVVELRKTKYLALMRISPIDTGNQNGILQGKEGVTFKAGNILFNNATLAALVRQMNYTDISPLPIINETGLGTVINLQMAVKDFYSYPDIKKQLNRIGFDLKEKEGSIKMLVIKNRVAQ
jgi:thiol-disulfide isomerase/thioredoxin